jgi:hypothetical protein
MSSAFSAFLFNPEEPVLSARAEADRALSRPVAATRFIDLLSIL